MRCVDCGNKTLGIRDGNTVLAVCPHCDRCRNKPAKPVAGHTGMAHPHAAPATLQRAV